MKRDSARKFADGFDRFAAGVAIVVALIFFLYLTAAAYLETSSVSIMGSSGEFAEIRVDNIFVNILLLIMILSGLYLFYRHRDDISLRRMECVLTVWTLLFGTAFIVSVKLCAPWFSDSYLVTYAAQRAARGDFSALNTYFIRFPFQLGFVLYEEVFFRICTALIPGLPEGYYCLALQGVNLLWLTFAFHALIMTVGNLSCSVRVQKMTALLYLCCLPAVMSCTFLYGNIPAFGCGAAAIWMYTEFEKKQRLRYALLCAFLLSAAVILKLNLMIFFAAIELIWLVELVRKFSVKSALCLVLTAALVLTVGKLPQGIYERRSGRGFGDGIPMQGWLAMGLSEGHAGPGWYKEDNTVSVFSKSGNDPEAVKENARKVIAERLAFFGDNPGEAWEFFSTKVKTQWNEPSYESIWINQVQSSYGEKAGLYDVFCSEDSQMTFEVMNQYQQLIFLGTLLMLLMLWKNRSTRDCLLITAVLGGLLYHLLFEAKSQYILTYFMLMVPMAAEGLCGLFFRISKR